MSRLSKNVFGILLIAASLAGCSSDSSSFTLYRNSVTDPGMRIHLASFDAGADPAYNRENCAIAARLFQNQQGVTTKYWCEKGAYRK